MLSDFFDTMGTIIGVGGRGGFLDARGRLPGANRVLLVDSLGAVFGGFANSSSNTTYIESAAGVAEGADRARPGGDGLLFLGAMFFSPLAERHPGPGDGAGADHRRLLHDGDRARDPLGGLRGGHSRLRDDAGDALHVVDHQRDRRRIRHLRGHQGAQGRGRELHWMIYLACAAFVVYFCLPLIESAVK